MSKYFKIGQKVYDVRFGEGTVTQIVEGDTYSIKTTFPGCGSLTYTDEGYYSSEDRFPSISQKPWPPAVLEELQNEFEDGEHVWVRDYNDESWVLRFYAKPDRAHRHYCYPEQKQTGNHDGLVWWNQCVKFDAMPMLTKK